MKTRFFLPFLFLALISQFSLLRAGSAQDDFNSGSAEYEKGNFNDAVLDLEDSVQKDPGSWEAYETLAYCYDKLGDRKKSLDACKTSLGMYPHNPKLEKFYAGLQNPSPTPTVGEGEKPLASPAGLAPFQSPLLPEHETSVYLAIGDSAPVSPEAFKEGWNYGLSAGAGIGLGVSRIFSLILDANLYSFPINKDYFTGYTVTGGDISDVLIMANGKFRFIAQDNPVVPYAVVGVGISFYNADPVTFTNGGGTLSAAGLNASEFAFRFALGIDIRLGPKTAIFLESNGVDTSTSLTDITFGALRAGLKLNL